MKTMVAFRFEKSLQKTFRSAARFRHMNLTQFLLQSAIKETKLCIEEGLGIKVPSAPVDRRYKR